MRSELALIAAGFDKLPGTLTANGIVVVNAGGTGMTTMPYAEGTFTPAVAFSGAAVGVTYASQVGFYTKIGNRVLFNLYVELTSNGSSTGAFTITGLPFTAKNTTNNYSALAIHGGGLSGMSGSLQAYIAPNATSITISYLGTGTVGGLDDTKVGDTGNFVISGQYLV